MNTASQIFDLICKSIENACAQENLLLTRDEAVRLGMAGGDTSRMNLSYNYTYDDQAGGVVGLHIRSVDPSGPCQNIPDINRLTVTITQHGKECGRFHGEYDD